MSLSIVLPVLNEGQAISDALETLSAYETIVVDGGSADDTAGIARGAGAARVLATSKGRAVQMNAGAAEATGDILVFLHADTKLPDDFEAVMQGFAASDHAWGRFDVRLSGKHLMFRLIAFMINQRSFLTGICTGDQAIFVRRDVFESIDGYADIPLMEDIEISRRLKRFSRPFRARSRVTTSSRRWEKNGITRTILRMWWTRLRYFLGVSPQVLANEYYP